MKARLGVLTLCVDDLDRAVRFYRALGLETPGVVGQEFEHGAVAFFDLQPAGTDSRSGSPPRRRPDGSPTSTARRGASRGSCAARTASRR